MNAQGADYSTWDDIDSTPARVDFSKAVAAGASFVFIKASQSTFADQDFIYNWDAAKKAGLPRGAYHYFTWDRSGREQMAFFVGLLRNDPGELPPVIDFECRKNAPGRLSAAANLLSALRQVQTDTGKTPIVYTSPGFWAEFGSDGNQFGEFPLWIAHYGVTFPKVPRPWNTWDFWQYTDRGDGPQYGSEAKSVDLNYYNGTVEEMRERFSVGVQPPALSGDKWRVKAEINIRTLPSQVAPITGRLYPGEIITAADYASAEGYTWAKHSRGWSAMYQGGFMEVG